MYRSRSSSGSRQSLGPLRVSKGGPESAQKSKVPLGTLNTNSRRSSSTSSARKSIARPSSAHKQQRTSTSTFRNSRRSSARGYEHCKDPRPITEKAYKEKCIRLLIEFLTENSYPYPITVKSLQSPLSKDFVRIFEFLMTFVDPKYKVASKIEEEIPRVLKLHGYPFSISKTSMFSVGSPHTWPTLLAALTWLREQIQYSLAGDVDDILFHASDEADGGFDTDAPVSDKKIRFEYCEKTYVAYLDGEDNFQQYEDELAMKLRNNGVGEDMDQISHEIARLKQELEALEQQPDQLNNLKDTLSTLKLDCSKCEVYVDNLEKHEKQLEQTQKLTDTDRIAKETELQAVLAENKKKKEIFNTQEFSPADVQRIRNEKQELNRQSEVLEKENQALDKQAWDLEMRVNKQKEKIEENCAQYNKICQMLHLIPITAENACGVDYELSSVINGTENTKFVTMIKPALMQVLNQCTDQENQSGEKLINEKVTFEQLEEMISQRQESLNMIALSMNRSEQDLDRKKENMSEDTQKLKADIQKLHEELSELRKREIKTLDDTKKRFAEEQARCKATQKSRSDAETQFSYFIEKALDLLISHKEKIQDRVNEVVQKMEQKLSEAESSSN